MKKRTKRNKKEENKEKWNERGKKKEKEEERWRDDRHKKEMKTKG